MHKKPIFRLSKYELNEVLVRKKSNYFFFQNQKLSYKTYL